jgi:signal transduction histidine kinase
VETVGLPASLQNLAAETQKFFDVPCTLRCAENIPEIDPQAALALFRITQEAIHNAITHGATTFIEIHLSKEKGMIRLMVRDNGCGFEVKTENAGMGLRVMQYRAQSLGGSFRIRSGKNAGSEIICLIPREGLPSEMLPRTGKLTVRS